MPKNRTIAGLTLFFASLVLVAVGILTMALSVAAQRETSVDYCSLFAKVGDTQNVVTKAYLSHSTVSRIDGGDDFLYSPNCNDPDHFMTLGVSKPMVWNATRKVFNGLPSETANVLEITFAANVVVSRTWLYGSLDGWARSSATISKVIAIRDITGRGDAAKPNLEGKAPVIERIRNLRSVVSLFLEALYRPDHHDAATVLADSFLLYTPGTETVRRDAFASSDERYVEFKIGNVVRTTHRIVASSDNSALAVGTLSIQNEARKEIAGYRCDIVLVMFHDQWVIQHATLEKVRSP
ncbi:MAG: hypothetical protein JO314_09675 [Acidobacteria bacterium]|nr:hypothetical protein [Acidobacteriota bacterium]